MAGHPPGALGFFVVLVRLGLGSGWAAGLVVTLVAASTAVAVLVTLKTLGAESAARKAAPFLVFGPAAVWQCVSADGMFAAVAAWGIAALAVAGTRRSLGWSLCAGLLLGFGVMLSYGLPLIGVLAVTVMVLARSWFPLIPAAAAALAVVLLFAAYGFVWWEALPVVHDRYWDGVQRNRPTSYWIWGNLAALAVSAGPVAGAGLGVAVSRFGGRRDRAERTAVWLAGAGVVDGGAGGCLTDEPGRGGEDLAPVRAVAPGRVCAVAQEVAPRGVGVPDRLRTGGPAPTGHRLVKLPHAAVPSRTDAVPQRG